jgi:hypothetical protein
MIEALEAVTLRSDCEEPPGLKICAQLKLCGTLYPLAMNPPN